MTDTLPPAREISLWIEIEGECTCGIPKAIGEEFPRHEHHLESDLGRIEHPNPLSDGVGPLMVTSLDYFYHLLERQVVVKSQRVDSALLHGGRMFHHATFADRSYTWELFPARWKDGRADHIQWMVGRWPD